MKKIVAIFLLICLVFTVLGYHFVFYVELLNAKAEMQSNIHHLKDEKDLTQLCLNIDEAKQLNWENKKEFSYKGKMYDVIEKHFQKGLLIVTCISDKNETALVNNYLAVEKNTAGNQPVSYLFKLITNTFIQSSTVTPTVPEKKIRLYFYCYSTTIISPAYPIHTPPPKIC